jgi:AraC-like DNA-binding protein
VNEVRAVPLDKMINKFLIEKKPFLRQKYSLGEMSKELDIPLHYLSAFINRHYNMNFNDLINRYRVSYSKLMIMNDEWRSKKLSTIAADAGFHNRNTFTTAFKKETGESPSEYVSRIKRSRAIDRSLLSEVEKALIENVA